jgi:UDP-2-acetamido-2,6-beta-L-arabino-hexul-4-ose reductase
VRVLITGADGFMGKNLQSHLAEREDVQVVVFTRENEVDELPVLLRGVDFVFHLAGVNRPKDLAEFQSGNLDLTQSLSRAVAVIAKSTGSKIRVVYTSSIQADKENAYGSSKRDAEEALFALQRDHNVPVYVFRLPNVFGKWCKPNYNSVVATFCNNVARGLPIQVNDPAALVTLVYVDDVIERFVQILDDADVMDCGSEPAMTAASYREFATVEPQYTTSVGELARLIKSFKDSRETLITERVGKGLLRALNATYVSYLPLELFTYPLTAHADPRGTFVEMLKTPDCGQFSFFTAVPGATRGIHYHHTKTEKFLVVKGNARFKFRQIQTGQTHEVITTGNKPEVVETVPGWTHDITNIGTEEMFVLLWANEVFDRARPDTFACPV